MEYEIAKLIAHTAFRSASDINNLIPMMKDFCSESECKEFGIPIATASYEIYEQILKKIYRLHPEIEAEMEQQVQKFGRVI